MTPQEQVEQWVAGDSVHNPTTDECCPDFSCCKPELLAPIGTRAAFQAAELTGDRSTVNKMLSKFLGSLIATIPGTHLAGSNPA